MPPITSQFEKAAIIRKCVGRGTPALFFFLLFATFYGSLKLTESSRFDVVPHEYGDERSPVDPSLAPRRLSFIRRPVIVAERRRARVSFERSHAIAVLHPSRVTTRHANASRRAVPFTTRYLAAVVFPVLEKKKCHEESVVRSATDGTLSRVCHAFTSRTAAPCRTMSRSVSRFWTSRVSPGILPGCRFDDIIFPFL